MVSIGACGNKNILGKMTFYIYFSHIQFSSSFTGVRYYERVLIKFSNFSKCPHVRKNSCLLAGFLEQTQHGSDREHSFENLYLTQSTFFSFSKGSQFDYMCLVIEY
jgi:hypothetical protein